MTTPQKKAVSRFRNRQRKKGIMRMEISLPKGDRELLRKTAANLRAGGKIAEQTRIALRSVLNPYEGLGFKALLERAPLDDVDLERSSETGRDMEF